MLGTLKKMFGEITKTSDGRNVFYIGIINISFVAETKMHSVDWGYYGYACCPNYFKLVKPTNLIYHS